jgi:uncharacterized protein involved in exopolysaccharide biosynthesis
MQKFRASASVSFPGTRKQRGMMRKDRNSTAEGNEPQAPKGAEPRPFQTLPRIEEVPIDIGNYKPFPAQQRNDIGGALRRHWLIALIPVILCVGLAVLYGLTRAATYSTETRMVVGGIDLTKPGALSGYATATQGLASSYARAVTADAVVVPVSRRLGVDKYTLAAQLQAAPVPDSPAFRVIAEGKSPEEAVRLANAASQSLISYAEDLNRPTTSASDLLRRYRRAAADYHARRSTTPEIRAVYERTKSPIDAQNLDEAVADERVAKLRMDSLYLRYQTGSEAQVGAKLSILNPAAGAWSDRSSRLQFFLFLGAVAGAAIGLALALLANNRQMRRRYAS